MIGEKIINPITKTLEIFCQEIALSENPATSAYFLNKVRGNNNARKGSRYEELYTGFKIAQEIVNHIEQPNEWPVVENQGGFFVDDLVFKWPNFIHYYQLKNTKNLSWKSGNHPLIQDFEIQAKFSNAVDPSSFCTTLVVACKKVHETMTRTMPSSIKNHSTVELFPYADGIANSLVIEHGALRNYLSQLTQACQPFEDDLVNLLELFISATKKLRCPRIDAVIDDAQKTAPSLVRLFPWQMQDIKLQPAFVNIIDKIKELKYGLQRGVFYWEAFGTSGALSFNCLSPDFERFQKRMIVSAPNTFEAFENLL